jgi:hypothetical protein
MTYQVFVHGHTWNGNKANGLHGQQLRTLPCHLRICGTPDYRLHAMPTSPLMSLDCQVCTWLLHSRTSSRNSGHCSNATMWRLSECQNVSLIRQGFMGTSPKSPKLAVCLRAIQEYNALRIHSPSLSVEKFAKALADRNGVVIRLLFPSKR